jgi:hypothetical protein
VGVVAGTHHGVNEHAPVPGSPEKRGSTATRSS